MKLEYVLSGLSHTKLATKYFEHEDLIQLAKDVFKFQQSEFDDHVYGLLFNAMTEKTFYQYLKHYIDDIFSIHSDSGGLQIAQQGKKLTDAKKEEIYMTQCLYSDVAMSFDDIPIQVVGDGSDARTNMNIKKFLVDKVEESGKKSGFNVNEQVNIFKKYYDKSQHKSKPLIVIQGNSKEDFENYFYGIISQIEPENFKYIGGYAIAGSSIGIGTLEAIDSMFSFASFEKPKEIGNRLHFLGYGSISRLLPVMTLKNTLFKEYQISYDSTTHTSKFNMGSIVGEDNKEIELGKDPGNRNSREIASKMFKKYEYVITDNIPVTEKDWCSYVTHDLTTSKKFHGSCISSLSNRAFAFLSAIYSSSNFIKMLERCSDLDYALCELKIREAVLYKHLKNCSADEWFTSYRNEFKRYFKSNRIERVDSDKIVTLEGFFS